MPMATPHRHRLAWAPALAATPAAADEATLEDATPPAAAAVVPPEAAAAWNVIAWNVTLS